MSLVCAGGLGRPANLAIRQLYSGGKDGSARAGVAKPVHEDR